MSIETSGPDPTVSDRLAIVNALISEDRSEIREHQTAVFHLTYVVIAGSIGIAAFLVDHPKYKSVLILGQGLLLAVYSAAFFAFRGWLADARACLEIRQSFYRRQELLRANPFTPIREIQQSDRDAAMKDKSLWFPFVVTVVSVIALAVSMLFVDAPP